MKVRLPDIEHWKAQVKCQTGCPVRTDAGRYVQLIAEGRDEEAYLVARAPNPFASVFAQPIPRRAILMGQILGLFAALVAAQAVGFGAAGLIVFSQSGEEGLGGFLSLVLGSAVLTAIVLGIAGILSAAGAGKRRSRALALALVIWFFAVVLYDVAALGAASFLPSGLASRLLIVSVLVNPVDAVRTGALLGAEGTTAFGSASLAFFRFTGGSFNAALLLGASALLWITIPPLFAIARLRRTDI